MSKDSPTLDKYCVNAKSSLRDVALCINQNQTGIALVIDEGRRLLGTITDGDLRRCVLNDIHMDTGVLEFLGKKEGSPITARHGTAEHDLLRVMTDCTIRQIPLLDDEGRLVDLFTMDRLLPSVESRLQAVIMAGGFGKRLLPLTENIPKPMLHVGDRPLLQRIVEQLALTGIRRVNLTTHYMAEKIRDHFGDGSAFGVDINYVAEDQPLGTAGALSLIEKQQGPLLVINGDILTKVDFRAMRHFHDDHKASLTVAVRRYEFQVPYGVLECDGIVVRAVREKPVHACLVNAGIYLVSPEAHSLIPSDTHYNMTDLIETLANTGKLVVTFPITEYWLDIGCASDFEKAKADIGNLG